MSYLKELGFSLLFVAVPPQGTDHSFPARNWTHEPWSQNLKTLDHQCCALVWFPKWFGNLSMYNMDWYGLDRIDVIHWVENCKLYNLGEYVIAYFKLKFTFSECLKMLLIRMLVTKRSWNLCSRSVTPFRLPKICSWNSKFLP